MHLTQEQIMAQSGYGEHEKARMRRWVKLNPLYRLNPPGKNGTVSATYVGPQHKQEAPNFEWFAAQGSR